MTREEAIKILEELPNKILCIIKPKDKPYDYEQAINFAIKALEERPKGKWIKVDVRNCHATLKCSVCDRVIEPTFTFGEYSYEDIKTFYPFCHCGADMRGDV